MHAEEKVFTDGTGVFPRDERLRRIAAAVFFKPGDERNWVSAVGGPQTVYRAELAGAVVAAERRVQSLVIVCDNMPVVDDINAVVAGLGPSADSLHGDLWARMRHEARTGPGTIRAVWIKSYLTLEQALERGFTKEDWAGNAAA